MKCSRNKAAMTSERTRQINDCNGSSAMPVEFVGRFGLKNHPRSASYRGSNFRTLTFIAVSICHVHSNVCGHHYGGVKVHRIGAGVISGRACSNGPNCPPVGRPYPNAISIKPAISPQKSPTLSSG